ncbi:MAG: transcription-repair coupling factor, partial [Paralcaligenes sp.]
MATLTTFTPRLSSTKSLLAALKPGRRHTQPTPPGSGDALLLADLTCTGKQTLVVLCADPLAAQRLTEEIPLFAPQLRVRQLPDWETLPYDSFSPHQDLISERLRTLHALMQETVDVLIVPVTTALYRLPPPSFLAAYTFSFKQGDKLDESSLRRQLTLANYTHVTQVTAAGEFCLRGGLIDLFPMGSVLPYRIDLLDNEIESIRSFDIDTQRSVYPVKEIQLLPGREFPMDETARNNFRARFREKFEGDPSRAMPYKDIGNGIAFAGVEYYLPLFFETTATLFDYLPANTLMATEGNIEDAIVRFHQDTYSRYQFLKSDRERPVLAPTELFLDSETLFNQIKPFGRLALTGDSNHPDFFAAPNVAIARRADDPPARLRTLLDQNQGRVALCADTAGRRETLLQMLAEFGIGPDTQPKSLQEFLQSDSRFALIIAPLGAGFGLIAESILLITENDLYPSQARSTRRGRRAQEHSSNVEAMVRDLSEL